jgi:NADPH:quinone reductase-like Zn-dependent oxidoreductase
MQEKARKIVMDYFNENVCADDVEKITMNDVYVVWFSKTLKNWKAMINTVVLDGRYYEVTHNGDTNETYLDVYKKCENLTVKEEA